MNPQLLTDIGKSPRLQIVHRLKRSSGLSVSELSHELGLSYMGIKQHCLDLEKQGYLVSARKPHPVNKVGRPQLIYTLTPKAHELYPNASNHITLELLNATETLYGPTAPEKLLFLSFQSKAEHYRQQIPEGSLARRAARLSSLREAEGYMPELRELGGRFTIIEHHSPIAELHQAHPALLHRLEQELYTQVLDTCVRRETDTSKGHYACVFHIGPAPAAEAVAS